MALIELNLEKPALKRTEIVEGREGSSMKSVDIDTSDDASDDASDGVDRIDMDDLDATGSDRDVDLDMDGTDETESKSTSKSGRGRRAVKRAAMVGAMTGAAVAARKIRARRKEAAQQTEVDEDWQTASN